MEEQGRERESRLVPPLGLSAKAQRMEPDGWAATPWRVGGREVLTNTEVLTLDRGPHRRGPNKLLRTYLS